ncbi:MAG TPA: hypothetical protein VMP68_17055 [Candidatus Eisenbacteria bacterium]|nr:hypothetical protein [Candidatus Eisenbacteria bacterium]
MQIGERPARKIVRFKLLLISYNFKMRVQVECYSAYRAEERPVRFRIEGREYLVEEVLDRWYGPNHSWYKVLGDDRNVYILRRDSSVPDGVWDLVSFRQAAG